MSDQIKVGEISPFFITWIFINKNCFMKQIFEILQEERDRILEMHEDATKKQYLMELEEPGDPGFGATQSELDKVDNSERALGAPEEKSKIKKNPSYTTQNWNQFSYAGTLTNNATVGFKPGAKFESTQDPKIVRAKNVKVFVRDRISGDSPAWVPDPKGQKNVSFYCKQGKFYFEGNKLPYVSKTLSKALVKYVCGYKKEKTNNTQQVEIPKPEEVDALNKKNDSLQKGSKFDTDSQRLRKSRVSVVSKPNDTALDQILTKIKTPNPVVNQEVKPAPQKWVG
jgi:hypothetical protein